MAENVVLFPVGLEPERSRRWLLRRSDVTPVFKNEQFESRKGVPVRVHQKGSLQARHADPQRRFAALANLVWCFLFADVTEPDDHGASQCQCHTYSFTCAELHIPVCAVRSQVKIMNRISRAA